MYSSRRSMGAGQVRGAKKGAHYSAPAVFSAVAAAVGALGLCLASGLLRAAPPPRPGGDTKKPEAERVAVKAKIGRITRELAASQVQRDRLTRDLKSAE